MLIKTNDGILNLVPSQFKMIYVVERFNIYTQKTDFWSVKAETKDEDFVLCNRDTKEEAEQELDKLWAAFRKNESSYDMTERGGQNEV